MKKLTVMIMGVMLLLSGACEKETDYEPQNSITDSQVGVEETVEDKYGGRYCVYFIEYGRWVASPFGFYCNKNLPGICSIERFCFPEIIFDPCWLIPCWVEIFDPWDIYEKINPREFESIRDKLELEIDPRIGSAPFALNEQIAGLQFYEQNELMEIRDKESGVFYLENDLKLDAETSRSLGLFGNTVKAGKYPVLVNPENETFNVILSVEKGFER